MSKSSAGDCPPFPRQQQRCEEQQPWRFFKPRCNVQPFDKLKSALKHNSFSIA
jgi:hypothetical protein